MPPAKKTAFLINVAFFSVIIVITYLFFKYVMGILMPFMIGLIFAMLLHKPIEWLTQKTKLSNKLFSVIFVLLLLTILSIVVWLLFCICAKQLSNLLNALPGILNTMIPAFTERLMHQSSYIINSLPGDLSQMAYNALPSFIADIQNSLIHFVKSSAGNFAVFTATNIPHGSVVTFITIISCALISMDYPQIKDAVKKQFPDRIQVTIVRIREYCIETLVSMCKVYLLLMVITFGLLVIFLSLWGIKNALAIAAVTALVDILPILGIGIVFIPWAIIALIMGNWALAVKLLISYLTITFLRNLIEPKLIGTRIGIHPVLSLLAIYVGLSIGGIGGMFGMVFLVIIIKRLNDSGIIHVWKSSIE